MLGRVRPERPGSLCGLIFQGLSQGKQVTSRTGSKGGREAQPQCPGESCLPASWAQHCQLLPPNEA